MRLEQKDATYNIGSETESTRRMNLFRYILAAVCLSGCSAPITPSDDSHYIEAVVVPQVQRWAKGSNPAFDLSNIAQARGYQSACIIKEYWPLDHTEKYLDQEIKIYSSNFGLYVPESNMALIFVRNGSAYAALIPIRSINFKLNFTRPCVKGSNAEFRRVGQEEFGTPLIALENDQTPINTEDTG